MWLNVKLQPKQKPKLVCDAVLVSFDGAYMPICQTACNRIVRPTVRVLVLRSVTSYVFKSRPTYESILNSNDK